MYSTVRYPMQSAGDQEHDESHTALETKHETFLTTDIRRCEPNGARRYGNHSL
jgi:hypothetical protein